MTSDVELKVFLREAPASASASVLSVSVSSQTRSPPLSQTVTCCVRLLLCTRSDSKSRVGMASQKNNSASLYKDGRHTLCDTKMRPKYLNARAQIIIRKKFFLNLYLKFSVWLLFHKLTCMGDRFMACAAATHQGRRGPLLFWELSIFLMHGQRQNRTLDKTVERPTAGHWVGRGMKNRGFSMKSFHSITTLVFLRQRRLDPGSCSGGVT